MSNIINLGNGGSGNLKGNVLETEVVSGKTFFSDVTDIKTGIADNVVGLVPYDLETVPHKYKLVDNSVSSYNLRNFKINSIPSTLTTWKDVCYGNGRFVVVAYDTSTSSSIMVSEDGINWTIIASPVTTLFKSICYGNGLFVAVSCYSSGYVSAIITSPDGTNWTQRTNPEQNASYQSICYNNGLFVVVAYNSNIVLTSPDGITWTRRNNSASSLWRSVCYGNGLFVAVSDSTTNNIATSPDGITWTLRTSPVTTSWLAVCYGNGLFVALSGAGNLMTSSNGITWTAHTIDYTLDIQKIKFINGMFIAASYSGVQKLIIYSYDGINWYKISDKSTPYSLTSLDFGNNILVFIQSSESIGFITANFFKD